MKKILFAALALAMVAGPAFAQDNDARLERERKRTEQNAVKQATQIAKTLKFDNEVKDDFTVLYTEYQLALADAQRGDADQRGGRRNNNSLTDEEVESNILAGFARERRVIDVREQYYREFRKILTPTQIQDVYDADSRTGSGNSNGNMMGGGMMGGPGGMGGPGMGGPGMGGPGF